MKKTLILGLMTLLLSGTVRAQWIVSDPENTYQGVLSVQQLKNTVSSLREQKKILDESLDYMRKVNATVSNSMTVKYLSLNTCFERRIKHEPVIKIIGIPYPAELYFRSHQPEFLQIIADGSLAYPHFGGQFT